MTTKIERAEHGISITIPEALAIEAHLSEHDEVDISISNGALVVGRTGRKKYNLDEMLAKITDENLHPEIDFGKPVGLEIVP